MLTNDATNQAPSRTNIPRRRKSIISGLAIRVLIALVLSWLIIMVFFVTHVVSH